MDQFYQNDRLDRRHDRNPANSHTRRKHPCLVAAIDFGTTFSGYAFAFQRDPNNIRMNKNWGNESGTSSFKTPTSVLIDGKEKFVAFGYKAEQEYGNLCSKDEGNDYNLFRHFKMALYHEKKFGLSTPIFSTRGRPFSAITVFSMALKYMKNHLIETVSQQLALAPREDDIQWVLTIPAIWDDQAKQFMREAAFWAGLINMRDSDQLVLALEPEAASILCRNQDVNHFDTEAATEINFPTGTKYMIIDAGGGTVDITAHLVLEDGNLEEIITASGGDWGGTQVDKNFEKLLERILGEEFIGTYKHQYPSQWLDIMTDFEVKKKALTPSSGSILRISLSYSIAIKYLEFTGRNIEGVLKEAGSKGIKFSNGVITISHSSALNLFMPVIHKIVNHVQEKLHDRNLRNLDYILLVGGFGESKLLMHNLRERFGKMSTVISPESAVLAVVKGSVLFGFEPKVVSSRIMRKTYGEALNVLFSKGVHDPMKMIINEDGDAYCRDVFRVFAVKNEKINIHEGRKFFAIPFESKQTLISVRLYSTERTDVMYVTDPGVTQIGEVYLKMPLVPGQSWEDRNIEINVYFGQTEIKVKVTDASRRDGETVETSINFLH